MRVLVGAPSVPEQTAGEEGAGPQHLMEAVFGDALAGLGFALRHLPVAGVEEDEEAGGKADADGYVYESDGS